MANQDIHADADAKRGGLRGIIDLFGKPKTDHRSNGDADPLLMPPRNSANSDASPEPPAMAAPSIAPIRDVHIAADPADLMSAFEELERIANEASGNHRGPFNGAQPAMGGAATDEVAVVSTPGRVADTLPVLPPVDVSSLTASPHADEGLRHAHKGSDEDVRLPELRRLEKTGDVAAPGGKATPGRENPIAKLSRAQDKLKAERDQARAERDKCKAQLAQLLDEVEKADRRVDAAKDDIAALRRTIAQRDEEINDLKHRLAKYDELDVKFQLMMSKARAVTEESKKAADVLREELAAERRKNAEMLASINDLVAKADMP